MEVAWSGRKERRRRRRQTGEVIASEPFFSAKKLYEVTVTEIHGLF